jgi:formylglycine-generating enzyme required for sulfatase activity
MVLSSISLTAHSALIDYVFVGSAGNTADTLNGRGAVSYDYAMGKTEVTNAQYAALLNAVAATDTNALYNAGMGSDVAGGIVQTGSAGSYTYAVKANMGNKPVNFVNRDDNKRFANWLHNGMLSGAQDATTTEDGAYDFALGGSARESDALVWLPSLDEWHKAAYHDPVNPGADGAPVGELATIDYWFFPTMSDIRPDVAFAGPTGDVIAYWDRNNYPATLSPVGPNTAIYASEALDTLGDDFNIGFYWGCADPVAEQCENVGSVGQTNSPSYWGTFDQAGNLRENLEQNNSKGGGYRESESHQGADALDEAAENNKTGFRVAGNASLAVIPVPPAVWLFGSGLLGLVGVARRRRRPV